MFLCEKFRINEKNFLASAHGQLGCTDCHSIRPGEAEEDIPQKKDIPDVNCTASCHREGHKPKPGLDPLSYPDSVHGRAYLERGIHKLIFGEYKESIHGRQALAGNADAPLCVDCHLLHPLEYQKILEERSKSLAELTKTS